MNHTTRWPGTICVIDTETTGLLDDPDARVIELAGVIIDATGREAAVLQTMVKPAILTDAGLDVMRRFNGIRPEWLENAPTERDALRALSAWLYAYNYPSVTSYNLEFDSGVVYRMDGAREVSFNWGPDCVKLAATDLLDPGGKWYSLREAIRDLDLTDHANSHRALDDARAAAAVLHQIRVRTNGDHR